MNFHIPRGGKVMDMPRGGCVIDPGGAAPSMCKDPGRGA